MSARSNFNRIAQDGGHADPALEALVHGRHGDPFSLLGLHEEEGALRLTVFRPGAERAFLVPADNPEAAEELPRIHDAGIFSRRIENRRERFAYRLRFEAGGVSWEEEDPYRFPPVLGDLDVHLMAEGRHLRLFEKLGAHPTQIEGVEGVAFAVFAPHAVRVSVVGDFNGWDGRRHVLRKRHEAGVWELFVPGLKPGELYKFEILGPNNTLLPLKADPFSFAQESPPSTASRVHGPALAEATSRLSGQRSVSAPMSIYEMHLGSWRRGEDGTLPTYDRLADELVPYVRDLGFTHVEFLPVSEHPFYGSWGYQPIGLFAPSARYGSPEAFTGLVQRFHEAGIGVIVDWVPAHFPSDPHGLARFDGTALYEHEDPRQGLHRDWNTLIYNFGRREVSNFLIANALYWIERFGIDGLRVDAVASMLYLDYSRKPGEWVANIHGGRENLEAIAFLKNLNDTLAQEHPDAVTIAEESTAWPGVSRPTDGSGLGFGFKWNMGWMHDTLDYMARDPIHRRYHHNQLTFGLLYAFSENFVLPLSHDEVVYGKGSLFGKMPGDRWQRFANLRAYYAFMWTHPGKKLLFMGGEFAQEREWNHDHSLDWGLLADPAHRGVRDLVRDLNHLYREIPALHRGDCDPQGFEWVDANDSDNSVLSYIRKDPANGRPVLVVCNFTPIVRRDHAVGVPQGGGWRERLNTDAACYGGSNVGNAGWIEADATPWHGRPFSLRLTLPPLATIILEAAA
ncbi:MAG: 1,4-alpha-glucan branching protein GlgB [Parvibaculaceae bacterium]